MFRAPVGEPADHLPLNVFGSSRLVMAANVNQLLQVIDAQDGESFTLQYTPSGGLPVIFDCSRGEWSRPKVLTIEGQLVTRVTLSCQAQPFGRSDVPQTIAVTTSSPPQLDSLDSVTAPTNATRDTTNKYEGTSSAAITLTRGSLTLFGQTYYRYTSPKIVKAISSTNLTAYSGLSLRFRWNAPTGPGQPYSVTVKLYVSDGTNESNAAVNISLSPGDTSGIC
jgi:hypothetical protein